MGKRLYELDAEQRERLILLRNKGVSIMDLSRQFFISVRQIREILGATKGHHAPTPTPMQDNPGSVEASA